jgi:hypothetical protein
MLPDLQYSSVHFGHNMSGTDLVVDNCNCESCFFQDETLREMLKFAVVCVCVCTCTHVPAQLLSPLGILYDKHVNCDISTDC